MRKDENRCTLKEDHILTGNLASTVVYWGSYAWQNKGNLLQLSYFSLTNVLILVGLWPPFSTLCHRMRWSHLLMAQFHSALTYVYILWIAWIIRFFLPWLEPDWVCCSPVRIGLSVLRQTILTLQAFLAFCKGNITGFNFKIVKRKVILF